MPKASPRLPGKSPVQTSCHQSFAFLSPEQKNVSRETFSLKPQRVASFLSHSRKLAVIAHARLTSAARCATIAAMSKKKDNNPSRGELVRLTARCKAAG